MASLAGTVSLLMNDDEMQEAHQFTFPDYVENRRQLARSLRSVADELERKMRDAGILKTSGGATGILSGFMAIGGVLLAPVTGGASIAITAAGIATGIASAGLSISADILKDQSVRQASDAVTSGLARLDAQEEVTTTLFQEWQTFEGQMEDLLQLAEVENWLKTSFDYTENTWKTLTIIRKGKKIHKGYKKYKQVRALSKITYLKHAYFRRDHIIQADYAARGVKIKAKYFGFIPVGKVMKKFGLPNGKVFIAAGTKTASRIATSFAAIGIGLGIWDIVDGVGDIMGSKHALAYRSFANEYDMATNQIATSLDEPRALMAADEARRAREAEAVLAEAQTKASTLAAETRAEVSAADAMLQRLGAFQTTLERQLLRPNPSHDSLVSNGVFRGSGPGVGAVGLPDGWSQDTARHTGDIGGTALVGAAHSGGYHLHGGANPLGRCRSDSYGGIKQTVTGLVPGQHYVLSYKGVGGAWDDERRRLQDQQDQQDQQRFPPASPPAAVEAATAATARPPAAESAPSEAARRLRARAAAGTSVGADPEEFHRGLRAKGCPSAGNNGNPRNKRGLDDRFNVCRQYPYQKGESWNGNKCYTDLFHDGCKVYLNENADKSRCEARCNRMGQSAQRAACRNGCGFMQCDAGSGWRRAACHRSDIPSNYNGWFKTGMIGGWEAPPLPTPYPTPWPTRLPTPFPTPFPTPAPTPQSNPDLVRVAIGDNVWLDTSFTGVGYEGMAGDGAELFFHQFTATATAMELSFWAPAGSCFDVDDVAIQRRPSYPDPTEVQVWVDQIASLTNGPNDLGAPLSSLRDVAEDLGARMGRIVPAAEPDEPRVYAGEVDLVADQRALASAALAEKMRVSEQKYAGACADVHAALASEAAPIDWSAVCGPTPTRAPTARPTAQPTAFPTPSPTPPPTDAPTQVPTPPPTPAHPNGPFLPPWNDNPAMITTWDAWCRNEVSNEGCYACANPEVQSRCSSKCKAEGCKHF